MIEIRKAGTEHVAGICRVCSEAYRVTYKELYTPEFIEQQISEWYTPERVAKEVSESPGFDGYWVALDDGKVIGATGGAFQSQDVSAIYVLYLDPNRKREGVGSQLVKALTDDQMKRGAKEQWVSVAKGNEMGIPFYEDIGFQLQSEAPLYGVPEELGLVSLRYKRQIA